MPIDDHVRVMRVLQLVVDALHHVGGADTADLAVAEAARYADRHVPWDGHGEEPGDRLLIRLQILTDRLSLATDRTGRTGEDEG